MYVDLFRKLTKTFRFFSSLKNIKSEGMFACLACNIEFSTQLDLDRHVDSTHGGRVPRKRKERKFLATEQATEGGVRSKSIRSGYKKKPRSQKFSQDDMDRQVNRAVKQALEESQCIHNIIYVLTYGDASDIKGTWSV